MKIDKVLILAPHIDDGEIGCGGTISKLVEEGKEIHYVGFSKCVKSLPERFSKDALIKELYDAAKILGIQRKNINVYDFPVREFPQNRQKILDKLIELRRQIDPDLVFIPSSTDVHQDHTTIYEEGVRAFKTTKLLGYEIVWNMLSTDYNFFVSLEEKYINKKNEALSVYESQKGKYYFENDFASKLAIIRGTQINERYAELFECIRWRLD